jgi:hypothetical protein
MAKRGAKPSAAKKLTARKVVKAPPVLPEFSGKSKTALIAELGKSPHGKLEAYMGLLSEAMDEPEFFAHLTTWNAAKGEVKDAKVALPVIGLATAKHPEFIDNALANLAGLDFRLFVRAIKFADQYRGIQKISRKMLRRLVERRLRDLEANPRNWERAAVQHRASLHYLYRKFHVPASETVSRNLFGEVGGVKTDPIPGTVFDAIRQLPVVSPEEAAGLILRFKIPWLVAQGALGQKATSKEIAFALVKAMSPTELIANTKLLQKKFGMDTDPALKLAYNEAIGRAGESKKAPTLKAGKAAEDIERLDSVLAAKLQALQEKQMETVEVDGDWLVLADKSGSMSQSIKLGMEIAAVLARAAKGNVHLVFFDNLPRYLNVTGKTLEEIKHEARHVQAGGGTSIGCGLKYIIDRGIEVDGIAIISDGAEHHAPGFLQTYQRWDKDVPIYLYHVAGEYNTLTPQMKNAGVDMETIEVDASTDYYSLPNLARTMRRKKYSLLDEIMNLELLKLDEVLENTKGMRVVAKELVAV